MTDASRNVTGRLSSVLLRRGPALLALVLVTACGGQPDEQQETPQSTVSPQPDATVDEPDENEPDENEPDENEPDENEPDENEPDENEPDENEPDEGR
jgi:hypothetical protein